MARHVYADAREQTAISPANSGAAVKGSESVSLRNRIFSQSLNSDVTGPLISSAVGIVLPPSAAICLLIVCSH